MRKAILVSGILFITFIVVILFSVPVLAIPQPPHVFYGAVTIDDKPAPNGLAVTATISGVNLAYTPTAQTSGGRYGNNLQFRIPADDMDTDVKEGGVNGDRIIFYVDGMLAGIHTFQVGGVTELNLNVVKRGSRSLPDPSTFVMVGSGLLPALLFVVFSRLRHQLNRNRS